MRSKSSLMTNSLCIQTAGFLWNKCHFSSHLLYQYQHTFYILIITNLCFYVIPPIHTKVSYPSVFLSYIVGVRLIQTVIHPLQVVTHSTPQAGAFPETNIPFIMYISNQIFSQTKMCVKHSLPNYEKITLTFDLKDDLDSILTLNFHYIIKSFCTVAQ